MKVRHLSTVHYGGTTSILTLSIHGGIPGGEGGEWKEYAYEVYAPTLTKFEWLMGKGWYGKALTTVNKEQVKGGRYV